MESEGKNERRLSWRGRSRGGGVGEGGVEIFNIVLFFCKDVTFSCNFVLFRSVL